MLDRIVGFFGSLVVRSSLGFGVHGDAKGVTLGVTGKILEIQFAQVISPSS